MFSDGQDCIGDKQCFINDGPDSFVAFVVGKTSSTVALTPSEVREAFEESKHPDEQDISICERSFRGERGFIRGWPRR